VSFPRYPDYKDSGVEWLGEVPAHWDTPQLRHVVRLLTEKTDRRDSAVALENIESFTGRYIPTETEFEGDGTAFEAGDLLFGKLRPYLAKAWLAQSSGEAVGDFHVLRPLANANGRFVQYAILDSSFISVLDSSTYGAKMPRASWDFMGGMRVSLPSVNEQFSIATFLDREIESIDALMAEQEKLIALLKEKRQALISYAVTTGLDPTAPMKGSDIDWLGDVPAHWEVRKLSSLSTKITNGFVGPTRDILVDDGVRYLQSLHIKGNVIRFDTPYFVRQEWSDAHAKSILEVGDVLIVQTGDIGQVAVVTDEFAGCNCHALIIVAPIRDIVTGEWLSWVFNADYGFHSLLSIQTGALHPHLNCGNVKDLYLPVPPMDEQIRIASYIAERSQGFDELTSEAQHTIDLLKERRSAMISAAVTGKVKVVGCLGTESEEAL
jgi:type I restriction enzyme S subunit